MLNKQLVGIIGSLLCLVGFFMPADIDQHCYGFLGHESSKALANLTCAGPAAGTLFTWWGSNTDWEFSSAPRIASALLLVAALCTLGTVLTRVYVALWGLVPLMIALIIYLQGQIAPGYLRWNAWIAIVSGCLLLIMAASVKESSAAKQ